MYICGFRYPLISYHFKRYRKRCKFKTTKRIINFGIFADSSVVVVRSIAINHLHLAVVRMSTVGLLSLFSFILRTPLAYDVSTNLER